MVEKLSFEEIISSYDGSFGLKLEDTKLRELLDSRRSYELLLHNPEVGFSYILTRKEEPGEMVMDGLDSVRDFRIRFYRMDDREKMSQYFMDICATGIVSFMEDIPLFPEELVVVRCENYSATRVIGVAESWYSFNNLKGKESRYIALG